MPGKPHVVVFGYMNLTGDSTFNIPTDTATEILLFSLKLLNRYETIETDYFVGDLSDKSLADYCVSHECDFIICGTITKNSDGTQLYELVLFDREKGKTTVEEMANGEIVMDVFDIADRQTASVMDFLVGRKLSFGSIKLNNIGKPVDYDIFVDDIPAPSGRDTIERVPDGNHVIHLVRKDAGLLDKPKTIDFSVSIDEGTVSNITFEFEPLPLKRISHKTIDMVSVTGGTFDNGTVKMTVSSFLIGKYEVTQKQYSDVMGINAVVSSIEYGIGDNYPVYNVSWYDAVKFCNTLSVREGYDKVYTFNGTDITADFTKNGYRLPTETEWEYAARGGTNANWYKYAGSDSVDRVAWINDNASSMTHIVGTKAPNKLGLYDMSGNVWEWCYDWYSDYPQDKQTNYSGELSGTCRVRRGGSWFTGSAMCTVKYRLYDDPANAYYEYGFRIVRAPLIR